MNNTIKKLLNDLRNGDIIDIDDYYASDLLFLRDAKEYMNNHPEDVEDVLILTKLVNPKDKKRYFCVEDVGLIEQALYTVL